MTFSNKEVLAPHSVRYDKYRRKVDLSTDSHVKITSVRKVYLYFFLTALLKKRNVYIYSNAKTDVSFYVRFGILLGHPVYTTRNVS